MTADTVPPQRSRVSVLDRVVALAGAASIVAAYAGLSLGDMGGKGVDPTMAAETIVRALQDHAGALRAGASLLSLGAVLAVVFAGALWRRLSAASEWVAVIAVAGAVLTAAQWLAFAGDGIGMATAADLGDGVTARVLMTAGWESARTAAVPSLAMVTATVVAGLRYGLFPRWFRGFSAVLLVPLVVALTPIGPSGLLGFVFGGMWLLVASVLLAATATTDVR